MRTILAGTAGSAGCCALRRAFRAFKGCGFKRRNAPDVAVLLVSLPVALLIAAPAIASPMQKMIDGAKAQVGKTLWYDGGYRRIGYPGGDVPLERGVCTDVVVRAFRAAGIDLQVLVHEDMKRNFRAYPRNWGLRKPDSNIDHRRVANLATLFKRKGRAVPVTRRGADYKPGDIVTWRLSSGVPHIGIVSDVRRGDRWLMVHNIGSGAQIEDVLFAYEVTGHFRWWNASVPVR